VPTSSLFCVTPYRLDKLLKLRRTPTFLPSSDYVVVEHKAFRYVRYQGSEAGKRQMFVFDIVDRGRGQAYSMVYVGWNAVIFVWSKGPLTSPQ